MFGSKSNTNLFTDRFLHLTEHYCLLTHSYNSSVGFIRKLIVSKK